MDICSYPGLIAACHVLLRLLMPSHSPYALYSLTLVSCFLKHFELYKNLDFHKLKFTLFTRKNLSTFFLGFDIFLCLTSSLLYHHLLCYCLVFKVQLNIESFKSDADCTFENAPRTMVRKRLKMCDMRRFWWR